MSGRWFILTSILFTFSLGVFAQSVKIKDFYQLADGNEWRYTAPVGWKDGDYVSRIERQNYIGLNMGDVEEENLRQIGYYYHYDATKAAKIIHFGKDGEIFYDGEVFSDGSKALFQKHILWFSKEFKIGSELKDETTFFRVFEDKKPLKGTFKITQKIVGFEDITVTAGIFKKALRIESETFWDLGDGRKARSVNIYHYAKNVGVIKASARFIILNAQGKETINRLVETDLKSAVVNGKKL